MGKTGRLGFRFEHDLFVNFLRRRELNIVWNSWLLNDSLFFLKMEISSTIFVTHRLLIIAATLRLSFARFSLLLGHFLLVSSLLSTMIVAKISLTLWHFFHRLLINCVVIVSWVSGAASKLLSLPNLILIESWSGPWSRSIVAGTILRETVPRTWPTTQLLLYVLQVDVLGDLLGWRNMREAIVEHMVVIGWVFYGRWDVELRVRCHILVHLRVRSGQWLQESLSWL